jgi:radical SAM superfamily enzyme YgiQ (UPF0313 family)
MRAPGDILLISCYELGHQPLNLASPLACLERAGYTPRGVDTAVETLDDATLAHARFIGISVPMHTALRLGTLVAARARAINPDAHICFYGLYASLNADYLLRWHADSVISGEYEQALLNLIEQLERAGGRCLRSAVAGVGTPARSAAPVLQRIPFVQPRRDTLPPLARYAQLEYNGQRVPAGYVEASRGCLHTCLHCPITPIYRGRFFVVPRDVVLADIRAQVQQGARHITFGDPDFLNGPGHSMKIARAMHQEFPDLTFDATIKIEHILEHPSLFPELRELGCLFIVSAVESLSDMVLQRLAKGHTRADVITALHILAAADIPMRASLVAFTPWTTLDDYLDMLDFIATHNLIDHIDPVQYTIRLLVPPGSALLDPTLWPPRSRKGKQNATAFQAGNGQSLDNRWLGPLDAENFTYHWDHPDPRMDELHRRVTALVEQAQREGQDALAIFTAIRTLAYSLAGREPSPLPVTEATIKRRTLPHLTESWFC